jgi:hypothetical protein
LVAFPHVFPFSLSSGSRMGRTLLYNLFPIQLEKKKKKKRLKMGWITNIFLKQFSVAYKILGKYKINL